MTAKLTTQDVLALSPDASSTKSGKKLGTASKWLNVGTDRDQNAVWGEIKGSGKKPYQTAVDLVHGPAFKCNCSSRKIPCKHAIGLMLIYAQDAATITVPDTPDWVQDWLDKRAARLAAAASPKPIDRDAQAKRWAKRQANIIAGLDELDVWMRDLIRGGLANVQTKPAFYYETPAKRLFDAQAPAIADRVQALQHIAGKGDHWAEWMLAELSQLHLIIEGFRRFDELPEAMQADLRTVVGWSLQVNELADEPGVTDTWFVLGNVQQERDKLREQRTWLCGLSTGNVALILDFAYGGAAFDHHFRVGEVFAGEIVFYPGAYPMRAVVRTRQAGEDAPPSLPGYSSLRSAVDGYGTALAHNPWTFQFPMAFMEVIPILDDNRWVVVDADETCLPLDPGFKATWELFALSGGRPVWLFGEWNGTTLYPLSAAIDNQVVSLI